MKKILIIVGHPAEESFSKKIGDEYLRGAKISGNEVKIIYLYDLKFNSNLENGYKKTQELEKDLIDFQEKIKWSEHIVLVHPIWWGGMPAKLKGLLDRTILPGFAFKFEKRSILPKQFFKGKSARVIMTKGGSKLFYFGSLGFPGMITRRYLFNFIGVFPVRTTSFYSIGKLSEKRTRKILRKVFKIGKRGK